eukprot:RCo036355
MESFTKKRPFEVLSPNEAAEAVVAPLKRRKKRHQTAKISLEVETSENVAPEPPALAVPDPEEAACEVAKPRKKLARKKDKNAASSEEGSSSTPAPSVPTFRPVNFAARSPSPKLTFGEGIGVEGSSLLDEKRRLAAKVDALVLEQMAKQKAWDTAAEASRVALATANNQLSKEVEARESVESELCRAQAEATQLRHRLDSE